MKEKQIYYRRKEKSILIEGKTKGQSVGIWTLPNDPIKLLEFLLKASYFPIEKAEKITSKINSLDKLKRADKIGRRIVRPIEINRNNILDAKEESKPAPEDYEKLNTILSLE